MLGSLRPDTSLDMPTGWSLALASMGILLYGGGLAIALLPEAFLVALLAEALLVIPLANPLWTMIGLGLVAALPAYLIIGRASLRLALEWVLRQRPAKDPRGIIQERHPDWDAHALDQLATRIETLAREGDPEDASR